MNVVLVSQCAGRALPATRRILDQFAERKGMRTWLTPITEAGLETLYELLRRGARRNTAVACHLVRGGEMELLWIVGNRSRFDRRGNVPTDTTSRSVLDRYRETGWRRTESIALLAAIAGLFHDFGKASAPFQAKLDGSRSTTHEPWRHEWLSVRLFEAFVGDDSDTQWLARLEAMASSEDMPSFDALVEDVADHSRKNPLKRLRDRPLARAVAWLVCSHHRLPIPRRDDKEPHHRTRADRADTWIDDLGPGWVTPRRTEKPSSADWKRLWSFPHGLPVASASWRRAAGVFGAKASAHSDLLGTDWMADPLAMHVARCALMLSDHLYSSGLAREKWQDASYAAYANTRWEDDDAGGSSRRVLNQKLDEHCTGVAHEAYRVARSLPTLRESLPAIGNVRSLRRRSTGRFAWQNKAFEMAERVAEDSRRRGGFFVDMASTGTGKTLANARMAFGLSKGEGCRFTVLLGLRTLTLQTAEALRRRIGLSAADLAVLVGSTVVRELHERHERERAAKDNVGSESSQPLFAEHEYVRYDGELDDSRIVRWLERAGRDGKLHRLVSARWWSARSITSCPPPKAPAAGIRSRRCCGCYAPISCSTNRTTSISATCRRCAGSCTGPDCSAVACCCRPPRCRRRWSRPCSTRTGAVGSTSTSRPPGRRCRSSAGGWTSSGSMPGARWTRRRSWRRTRDSSTDDSRGCEPKNRPGGSAGWCR